jgi:hypothetical protein
MMTGSFLLSFGAFSSVQVKHNEDECGEDGRESAEEVGVGHEQKPLEFVVFVGSNRHSFCLSYEVESGSLVDDLELIDAFLFWSLSEMNCT